MVNKIIEILKLSLIFIFLLLFSCITIENKEFKEITVDEIKVYPKNKIKVFIDWDYKSLSSLNFNNLIVNAHKNAIKDVVNESGCCEIIDDINDMDFVIRGYFFDKSDPNALRVAFLTGISLYIIPTWINSESLLEAKIFNRKNSLIESYQASGSVKVIQWLPLLMAMPFKENSIKQHAKSKKNLYRELMIKIKNSNIFSEENNVEK